MDEQLVGQFRGQVFLLEYGIEIVKINIIIDQQDGGWDVECKFKCECKDGNVVIV